jgi:hypothetical protein
VRLAHEHELLRRRERWWPKQHGVHDAEHGRRSADAEGEGEKGDDRESRLSPVRSDCDARVGDGVENPVSHGGVLASAVLQDESPATHATLPGTMTIGWHLRQPLVD